MIPAMPDVYRILDAWPAEMWLADDLLGWAHEAWMAADKDRVNREANKIGGKDLHPVTQLMSEDYMIRYLLQNTLGGWWMHRHPKSTIGDDYEYMIRNEDGSPVKQVQCTGWPDRVREIKIMDPCVGAGGFLLEALEMLIPMWEFEEGLTGPNAVDLILIRNLHGMDIDNRILRVCENQLTMLAWKRSGFRTLPVLNLGWTGDRRLHPDADHLGSLLTVAHLDIDPNRPQERETRFV